MTQKKAFTLLPYLASIVFLPWWISFSFKKSLEWVINWWNTSQSEAFLNGMQEKSVLENSSNWKNYSFERNDKGVPEDTYKSFV